jgi:hypothetical protein
VAAVRALWLTHNLYPLCLDLTHGCELKALATSRYTYRESTQRHDCIAAAALLLPHVISDLFNTADAAN